MAIWTSPSTFTLVLMMTPLNAAETSQMKNWRSKTIEALTSRLGSGHLAADVSAHTMLVAAQKGMLDIVQWIYSEFSIKHQLFRVDDEGEGKCYSAIDAAARNGHLDVVQCLHQVSKEAPTIVMPKRRTARFASLCSSDSEELSPPDEPSMPGCTKAAMYGVAANGHLAVVRWLHANRKEGCSADAMDNAANNDHLELVRWLHENTAGGCMTAAMDGAAGHGALDVVK